MAAAREARSVTLPTTTLPQTPSCLSVNLDPDFGVGGRVVTSFPGGLDTASDVAIQSDGKIVVVGSSGSDIALTRYNTNGTLDGSFGTGGRVNTDFPTGMGGNGRALVIQADGKIVVAGSAVDPVSSPSSGFALVRYNTNGSLDTSFDGDGRVVTGFAGSSARAGYIVLQADGKLVVVGTTNTPDAEFALALARYNSDGSLDNTFDGDGKVSNHSFDRHAAGLAIQGDGRILSCRILHRHG